MIKQRFITGSSLPNCQEDKLLCWLSKELGARVGQLNKSCVTNSPIYWGASYFGLNRVKSFLHADLFQQAEILRLCNYSVLEQIYTIEKACVNYMAKMVLIHERPEEQMLYSLFGADEAMHLAKISSYLLECQSKLGEIDNNNQLFKFLNGVIDSQDKALILFVLLVLDGWSLSYYRSLAIECREPDISLILQGFLTDKSRHHATEVVLFHNLSLTIESQSAIVETLSQFLQIMQVEPQQTIVTAIERVKGNLSQHQKVRIFEELDTEAQSISRLKFLRSLMRNPNSVKILQMLEADGAFQPFKASDLICV
jgi:hypothetical protein